MAEEMKPFDLDALRKMSTVELIDTALKTADRNWFWFLVGSIRVSIPDSPDARELWTVAYVTHSYESEEKAKEHAIDILNRIRVFEVASNRSRRR